MNQTNQRVNHNIVNFDFQQKIYIYLKKKTLYLVS